MKYLNLLTTLIVSASVAAPSLGATETAELTKLFEKTKNACSAIKNFGDYQKEVLSNYKTMVPETVDSYLPSKVRDNNAGYLFVNPKEWHDMSPKLQIALTQAAYLVEVCNPQTRTWPTLVIADWKTRRPIGTRTGWEIGGWFGK